MLHFTLSGSSDMVVNVYFLIYFLVYFFVSLESGGRFRFEFKFGIEIDFELGGFFEEFFFKCLGEMRT
jgi:hypothetical protein